MSEYVVMPKSDYVSACDTLREKTGSTEPIKSNELIEKINQLGPAKEEQEKVITITENGTTKVVPDEGKTFSKVTVNVNVSSDEDDFSIDDYTNVLTSGGKNFSYLFDNLNIITYSEVSKIIHNPLVTSNGTNFSSMFHNCHKLSKIPEMDTSNGTNFSEMFHNCFILTTVPEMNTSNGTNFSSMFRSCSQLTTLPKMNTSKGTNFGTMFMGCEKLVTISEIDVSNSTNLSYMFNGCSALQNVTIKGEIATNIDFGDSPLLSSDSVGSIGNAVINLIGQNSKTITFNKAVIEGMSDEQKAVFTNKNWTIVSKG